MSQPYQLEAAQSNWPAFSGNVYCIGRNYADHAKELGNEVPTEPVIFLKAPSALRQLKEGPLAFAEETFHHELELCLLVGRRLEKAADVAADAVIAVSLGLDLTRRAVQDQLKKKGLPWTTAKSFAGAGVLAPFVTAHGLDLTQTDLQLEINGEMKQAGNTKDMIFPCLTILRYLTQFQSLQPGDIIFTGTPAGVGPIRQGDRIRLFSRSMGLDALGVL